MFLVEWWGSHIRLAGWRERLSGVGFRIGGAIAGYQVGTGFTCTFLHFCIT